MSMKTLASTSGHAVGEASVAEWVGLHFGKNLSTEGSRRQEWVDRFVESHPDEFPGDGGCDVMPADGVAATQEDSLPSDLPVAMAYQATEDDIEAILREHWAQVANTNGRSFESMAVELIGTLDQSLVERAALRGCELDQQTVYANEEIVRQLRASGVLEPLVSCADELGGAVFKLISSTGLRSISDDDLCSGCDHCNLDAACDLSQCVVWWPGQQDSDGYVTTCLRFVPRKIPA